MIRDATANRYGFPTTEAPERHFDTLEKIHQKFGLREGRFSSTPIWTTTEAGGARHLERVELWGPDVNDYVRKEFELVNDTSSWCMRILAEEELVQVREISCLENAAEWASSKLSKVWKAAQRAFDCQHGRRD